MSLTATNICTDALLELNLFSVPDAIAGDELVFALGKLNRLLDNWNADRRAIYTESFADFTLTPNLSPHTIGPSGTFIVTQRPVSLEAASINLGGSPAVLVPLQVRDAAWYAARGVPGITQSLPTDVYYAPDWPNGKLYFYGVPTTAYGARLWSRALLAQLALTDAFSLPPGYQDAITLTLAEDLASAYGQPVPPELGRKALEARARIFDNNSAPPSIATRDAGMPGRTAPGGTYLNGWFR